MKESNEENSFLIEIEETSCRNLKNRRKKFSIEITIYRNKYLENRSKKIVFNIDTQF